MVQESDFTVPHVDQYNTDVDMVEPASAPGMSTSDDTTLIKAEENWDLTKDSISPESEFLEDLSPVPPGSKTQSMNDYFLCNSYFGPYPSGSWTGIRGHMDLSNPSGYYYIFFVSCHLTWNETILFNSIFLFYIESISSRLMMDN